MGAAKGGGQAQEGLPLAEVRGVGVGEGPASASATPADLLLESEVLFWRVWPTRPGVAPSLPRGGVRPAGDRAHTRDVPGALRERRDGPLDLMGSPPTAQHKTTPLTAG